MLQHYPRSPKYIMKYKVLAFFHRSGYHTVNFSSHRPKKNAIMKFFKLFSVIKIDKQSSNTTFWDFILILSVPQGQPRTKCPCHTTFVHQSGTSLICFCGNTDVSSDDHHGSDGFIPTIWTLSSCEVVKLKLMRYIPQHLYVYVHIKRDYLVEMELSPGGQIAEKYLSNEPRLGGIGENVAEREQFEIVDCKIVKLRKTL